MKSFLKSVLQRTLGFKKYLVAHSIFVALTLRLRRDEGAILQFIDRLPLDATVLDVGANVGAMTLLFSRRCTGGRVFAFEPIPENLAATQTIVRLFALSNVTVFSHGLGERDETVTMIMPSRDGVRLEGLSHVASSDVDEEGERYNVTLRRLDGIEAFDNIRIDAIKIDVENHERYVLAGAEHIIARDRPMIYAELWSDDNRDACFVLLQRYGYRAFGIGEKHELEPFDRFAIPPQNVFFLPDVT